MIKRMNYFAGVAAICALMTMVNPVTAFAASGPAISEGSYIATVTADHVNINKNANSDEVLLTAKRDNRFPVVEDMGDGWMKVQVGDQYGYLPVEGNAQVKRASEDELAAAVQEAQSASRANVRQNVVDYALQFLGGRYSYGGSNPVTGTDCSGFTSYIMRNAAGVNVGRSSTAQAAHGVPVSADQMQPGDLIFYGNGRSINHVAMYIGDGQIVHASTYATGIKISNWNYRPPVKIVNVLG